MTPLVSVIIPTTNRPHYLPCAVQSALEGMQQEEVEVIIVPNGPDDSWRKSLLHYQNNPSVRIIPIAEANANIARNTGLDAARGKYIRFLDDDDYLVSNGAIKQYELIQLYDVDVISGSIKLIDEEDHCLDIWHQPETNDLCAAVLTPSRNCLPMAHVYKRSRLVHARWNPETVVRQDIEWLIDLCISMELTWLKVDDVVGVWRHHWDKRISSSTGFNEIRKQTAKKLLRTYKALEMNNRLNELRRESIALGLWTSIHTAFFFEPFFWSKIAHRTHEIRSKTRPIQTFYQFPIIRLLNPLFIQWIMLPKRWTFYKIRSLLKKLHIRHSW